jgi:hypothetical protein
VKTLTGNLKTAIVSTLKSVDKCYMQLYFDECQWRFNRHVDLLSMLGRLANAAANETSRAYRTLKIAYEAGQLGSGTHTSMPPLSAPSARACTHQSLKDARQVALIGEATNQRNLSERQL